jgi:acyl-CoA thioester hydrolase
MTKAIASSNVEIEIPFFDVDLMEIVWHGHYLKYFEVARCVLLDKIDYSYMKMRESGYVWPVIDIRIRYAKPAHFGQKIIVFSEISEWENRLKINYKIIDKETGQRLTRGHTCQVAVDIQSQQMCYQSPAVLWQKLGLPEK